MDAIVNRSGSTFLRDRKERRNAKNCGVDHSHHSEGLTTQNFGVRTQKFFCVNLRNLRKFCVFCVKFAYFRQGVRAFFEWSTTRITLCGHRKKEKLYDANGIDVS